MPTEEFSGEEVIYLGFTSCGSLCVLKEARAYRFKQGLVNDGWNTILYSEIFVLVNADVPLIAENGFEGAAVERSTLP